MTETHPPEKTPRDRWKRLGSRPGQHARTHNSWTCMKQRCQNPKSRGYPEYGGRGITVCDRWQSFEAFFLDMGPKPEGKSLERIDNALGYFPENCRWATATEQTRNRRAVGSGERSRARRERKQARKEALALEMATIKAKIKSQKLR